MRRGGCIVGQALSLRTRFQRVQPAGRPAAGTIARPTIFAAAIFIFTAVLAAADRIPVPLGLDAYLPVPEDNPVTAAKAALGRSLFFDKRLSRDQSISCATCHDPKLAFTDRNPVGVGVRHQKGERRVPRLINRAYGTVFFWDGRAPTLEDQVVQPISNPIEMDLPLPEAAQRVGLDALTLRRALATYVRTILSGDSPYDRYLAGDKNALSPEALAGLHIFRVKGGCIACHLGPNLTDERFHNTGVGKDAGRAAITHNADDAGAFKTPSLREVARTAPYMHDGSIPTLDEVVEHYNRGGGKNPNLDPELQELRLTAEEKRALIAFLHSLNGAVREGLPSEVIP